MLPTSTDEQLPEATKSPHRSTSAPHHSFPEAPHASTTSAWSIDLPLRARLSLASSPLALSGSANLPSRPAAADMDILRIYVPLHEMPFAWLDALHTQPSDDSHPVEIHVCVQSLLRPALQQVYESLGLERGLVSTIRNWHALGTALKFFFLHPNVPLGTGLEIVSSYQQVELLLAIKGLTKGSLELFNILALGEGVL
jgi:hypothetical protein